MITTVLNGGLGNQLFQIAVAYALSRKNNDTCAFDFERKVINQGNMASVYKDTLYSTLSALPRGWKPDYRYKEPTFSYRPIEYRNNMQLEGYFQSLKYFSEYENEIRELFLNEKTNLLIDKLRSKIGHLLQKKTVSLHIRRGDYLKFNNIHPQQDISYYNQSMDYIEADIVFVFSDDIGWCRNNIKLDSLLFINGQSDYEDMLLMSLCNHNIITGSSFSWWGAFLNRNKDKIVVAPKKWFGEGFKGDWSDVYTEKMIVL